MKKEMIWQYIQARREIVTTSPYTGECIDTVMQTEDINPDTMEILCDQYNEGYSHNRIKSNLEQDERLTGDEVDYIMEQIELWEEKEQTPTEKHMEEITKQEDEELPVWVNSPEAEEIITAVKETGKKKRQPKIAQSTISGVSKLINTENYIKQLEEKIQLTKLINETMIQDINTDGLSKNSRDIILSFHKDHQKLIGEYMQRIQQL